MQPIYVIINCLDVINQRSRREADSRRSLYSWNKTSGEECVQREFKIKYVSCIFK